MKTISLTQNQIAIVDNDMYDLLVRYKWHAVKHRNTFYAVFSNQSRKRQWMHRYVLGNPPQGLVVDHVNGNGLDNRRSNLRFVTQSENQKNRVIHRKGHLLGTTFFRRDGTWKAQVRVDGKQTHIGYFSTELLAHEAYKTYLEINPMSKGC